MFEARNKNDLMIEVWEKLDCESVGAEEILAIEEVVLDRFGTSAVESPMIIARILADEGRALRHSEIMDLYVKRASDRPYEAAFRNAMNITDLDSTHASIKRLENLRRKYLAEGDKEGLRIVREEGMTARKEALKQAKNAKITDDARQMNAEIAEWLTLWMQSPEMFETWIAPPRIAGL